MEEVTALTKSKVLGELVIETTSVAVRLGMADIWTWLRGEGLRLAVCSNLSSDYVAALRDTLPGQPEVVLSKPFADGMPNMGYTPVVFSLR